MVLPVTTSFVEAALTVGGAVLVVLSWLLRSQPRGDLRAVAGALGLRVRPASVERHDEPVALMGERGGYPVTVELVHVLRPDGPPVKGTRLALRAAGRWPADARLPGRWRSALFSAPDQVLASEPTSEPETRRAAELALFDAATSGELRAWMASVRSARGRPRADGGLEAGALELLLDGIVVDAAVLSRNLDGLVEIAEHLDRRGRNVAQCLVDGLATATGPERRERLRILADRFSRNESARAALEAALDDPEPGARCEAARGLGERGRGTLVALARDAALPPALRGDALAAWGATSPEAEDALGVVEALVDDASRRVRIEALRVATGCGVACPLPALMKHVAQASDEEAVELAQALGRHAAPEAEAALRMLLRRELPGIRLAVLAALRDVGTVACVPDILPLSKALLGPADVRAAARVALRAVRARLAPAEAGQLSWIEDDASAGQLSAAGLEGGSLSPAPGLSGALSQGGPAGNEEQS